MNYKLSRWRHPTTREVRVYINVPSNRDLKVYFYAGKQGQMAFSYAPSLEMRDFPDQIRFLEDAVSVQACARLLCEEVLDDQGLTWDDEFSEIEGCAD